MTGFVDSSDESTQSESSEKTHEFDGEAFLDWLEDQEGTIPQSTMEEEWPNFPYEYMTGVTCLLVDNESQYFQRDLRRAARRMKPID